MSRIGKKPIPLPAGVKYKVEGNTVLVEGPKGKVSALIASGITLETKDGFLNVLRESDKVAAFHGLTRALVFNAVHGVTTGWKKDLDIVGIGYRAELKGKGMVVFTLGYSHPIEFPLPTGIEVAIDPKILDNYVGSYELAPNFILTVTREGDRLFTQATGQGKVEVFPESDHDFFLKVIDAQITFETDSQGKATGLVLHQGGDHPARRIQ